MGLVEPVGEAVTVGPRRPALRQTGKAGEVWAIAVTNLVFTVLTLGIYRFWGVARLRRYLWSHTEFEGEPLEYTGTGKEQFIGFLLALVVVLLPLGLLAGAAEHFLLNGQAELGAALQVFYMLALLSLPGFAMYRARRYRLSRTVWRGIRGAQTGSAAAYGLRWTGWLLLVPFTLGLIWPLRSTSLMHYKMNRTFFGARPFEFQAKAGPLYGKFLTALVGAIAIAVGTASLQGAFSAGVENIIRNGASATSPAMIFFGVIILAVLPAFLMLLNGLWYMLHEWKYFAGHTRFGGLRFSIDATAGQLLALIVTNVLLTLLTLGLGAPYARLRIARFICAHLFIEGGQDFAEIAQSAEARPRQGEGLAAMFDSAEF